MSIKAINWAWGVENLEPPAKLILMRLADYADEHGSCYPAMGTIGKACCIKSRATVRKHLATLSERDLVRKLSRVNTMGGTTAYRYFLAVEGQFSDEAPNLTDAERGLVPGSEIGEDPSRSKNDQGGTDLDQGMDSGVAGGGQLCDHASEPPFNHQSNHNTPQAPQGGPLSLEDWQPKEALVKDLARRLETHRLVVLYAVGAWKAYQEARGGRIREGGEGVAFETYVKRNIDDLRKDYWARPPRDWSADDWAYLAFKDFPAEDVRPAKTWPNGKLMPLAMSDVREWDRDRFGPAPWEDHTLVPTVLIERYKPWFADKIQAAHAKAVMDALEAELGAGKAVRVPPEWRPSTEETQAIAAEHDLMTWEVSAMAPEFASYMHREGDPKKKNIRVKSPLASFRRWVAKRANDAKACRGQKPRRQGGRLPMGAKPVGPNPITSQDWRDFLGEPTDATKAKVLRAHWGTMLHQAREAAQVNPWEAFNGELPMDVHKDYGHAWGWVGIPAEVLRELSK